VIQEGFAGVSEYPNEETTEVQGDSNANVLGS